MKSPLIVKWRYWENAGTRPRVDKSGTHGLFSDDDYVSLDEERKKLKDHRADDNRGI